MKLITAIKYTYLSRKASKLAYMGDFDRAYKTLRKIDANKLKGSSRFKVSLMQAVILSGVGNYELSKQMMEFLFISVEEVSNFNDSEINYIKLYIKEQYDLITYALDREHEILLLEEDDKNMNLDLVSNNIKAYFPIDNILKSTS